MGFTVLTNPLSSGMFLSVGCRVGYEAFPVLVFCGSICSVLVCCVSVCFLSSLFPVCGSVRMRVSQLKNLLALKNIKGAEIDQLGKRNALTLLGTQTESIFFSHYAHFTSSNCYFSLDNNEGFSHHKKRIPLINKNLNNFIMYESFNERVVSSNYNSSK